VRAENVAQIPECAECERPWLPADEERWCAPFSIDDELILYCPSCAERAFGDD